MASRRFSRVVAAVCGVAVLLGGTACDSGRSSMNVGIGQEAGPKLDTDGEPFIHANHDRGAEPGVTFGDFDDKGLQDYSDEFMEWGLKQTPDWLEICNTINKAELRKLGIDPQKDLLQREGGEGKRWVCVWKDFPEQLVAIARIDAPMEEASRPPRFKLHYETTVNGKPARVGQVQQDLPITQACAVDYYYQGTVYSVAYQLARVPEDPHSTQACDAALALAERGS